MNFGWGKRMSNIMISVIIPIYNCEQYLEQCLDSITNQTLKNIEVICVDDGSTDDSLKIVLDYSERDKRIKVLTQHNQYAGVARNQGLTHAKGKYVLFLDADDFFDSSMLEKLYYKAEMEQTEVLVFDAFQYDNKQKQVINTSWEALRKRYLWEGIKKAEEVAEKIYAFTSPAPWNKFFLREFVLKNDLWFQSIPRTNDLYFVYAALSCAKRIGILNEKLLFYRDNNETSLQGEGERTPTIFLEALRGLEKYLKEKNIYDIYRDSYERLVVDIAFYNLSNMKSKESYCLLVNALKNEELHLFDNNDNTMDVSLINEIKAGAKVIIYGAGVLAKILVNYLLYMCGYEKDNIKIVVSNLSGSVKQILEIEVGEFGTLPEQNKTDLVVIAVMEEHIQAEIEKSVQARNFNRIVRLGIKEMSTIIREV